MENPKNCFATLKEAINHVPDAVIAIDTDGKITLWNPAAEQLTGLTRETVLGQGYEVFALDFYPPESLRQQYDELKRTTALLETAHSQMLAVIEHLPDAAFVIDRDKKVIAWNKAMEHYSSVPKDKVLGTADYATAIYQPPSPMLIDFVGRPEEEAQAHYGEFFRRAENGVLYTEGVQPNVYGGKSAYVAVMAAPLLDTAGNMVGAIESIHDLTLMREKDDNLRASEGLLREITNHMSDLLCKISRTGIVEYVSPSFLAAAGVSPSDIIGKHYASTIHPDDIPVLRQIGLDMYSPDTPDSRRIQFRARSVQGHYRSLDGQGSVIRDSTGGATGTVYVLRDVTEQKAYEERLEYLRRRDTLTGCFNRSYFEELLDGYYDAAFFPLAIIVVDLDGLKTINTSRGHHLGDMLLQAMVSVVDECLAPEHFLARVGGDELAIILPNSTQAETQAICSAIDTRVTAYNLQFPALPLSLSLGYALSETVTPIKALFELADTVMNRKKLTHRQSNRSSLVQTMMKALESRDYLTEGHADRLQDLVTAWLRACIYALPPLLS